MLKLLRELTKTLADFSDQSRDEKGKDAVDSGGILTYY